MVIDIHTHTFCPSVETLLNQHGGAPITAYRRDMSPESRHTDAEQAKLLQAPFNVVARRLDDMKRMGIDRQVISPAPGQFHYGTGPLIDQISRIQNDHVASLVASAPHVFLGVGTLPMPDIQASIREASRAVQQLGLRGFQIDTQINEIELSDRSLDPLWAHLARLDVPVIIHPLGFSNGQRLGPFFMVNTVGQPLEEIIAFQHLVFGGVIDRHPELKVLICHGGGYAPFYIGRLDHAWAHRSELKRLTVDPPSAYLKRFYFDSCVFRADLVGLLVTLVGSDRVLMGSDYPFDMGDPNPVAALNNCSTLSSATRQMIMGQNAMKLFRITDDDL
ncbi:aminocarboxymuconate-semialdehyde decarboxylase [Acidiphilium sp. MT5]